MGGGRAPQQAKPAPFFGLLPVRGKVRPVIVKPAASLRQV